MNSNFDNFLSMENKHVDVQGMYFINQLILFIDEGDFSFSSSLTTQFNVANNIVTTFFDSRDKPTFFHYFVACSFISFLHWLKDVLLSKVKICLCWSMVILNYIFFPFVKIWCHWKFSCKFSHFKFKIPEAEVLQKKYHMDAIENINNLTDQGAQVFHGVNARNMATRNVSLPQFAPGKSIYDVINFNFPMLVSMDLKMIQMWYSNFLTLIFFFTLNLKCTTKLYCMRYSLSWGGNLEFIRNHVREVESHIIIYQKYIVLKLSRLE